MVELKSWLIQQELMGSNSKKEVKTLQQKIDSSTMDLKEKVVNIGRDNKFVIARRN
jgi:hypothetical protein